MSALALLAPALLTLQSAPPVGGFSADDLAGRAGAHGNSRVATATRRRAAATDMLRAAFVLDMASAWRGLAPDERAQLRLAVGPDAPLTAPAMGWFMHGASVRLAGRELAGLYNPIADVWLVLHWRTSGGAPRIAAAFLVPGGALRPADEAGAWSERDGPYAAALATADAQAAARFLALGEAWPAEALVDRLARERGALRDGAFARITPWLGGLRSWQRSPAWTRLQSRLVAADGFAATLASMPLAVRRSLVPLGAIQRADGGSLLLGSPLAPGRIVAVDDPEGRPGVQLVDLNGAARQALAAGGGR